MRFDQQSTVPFTTDRSEHGAWLDKLVLQSESDLTDEINEILLTLMEAKEERHSLKFE